MTQEDKELLLRDLSSRLPYGVKFVIDNGQNNIRTLTGIDEAIPYEDWQMCAFARGMSAIPIEDIKPYLFPMSSMTKEQKEEFNSYFATVPYYGNNEHEHVVPCYFVELLIEFFHKNHIDNNGLIEKGLALDATGLGIY